MSVAAIDLRFGLLHGMPEFPQGYYHTSSRLTPNGLRLDVLFKGARIFEIAVEVSYTPGFDDPTGVRYAARTVGINHAALRTFNSENPWIEYTDLPTMLQAMFTRHRIGL